ncbi:hypothetical protein RF11_11845 [Thelohanellus kitauei]|uniref:Uncharacterized protein n=1 Tax=Thelohanellus kitauei TaxID=669202 RepID=A0A0C2N6H5_THEKT|nr:hypothetical protein RF11_11845 [Thelohanellus kitauei]
MSDRVQAQNVVDNLIRPQSTVIIQRYIHMPGVGRYEISLKENFEGAYFVIRDQNGSEPRIRICVHVCELDEFLNELCYAWMLFKDFDNWSISDRMGTDFDRVSYAIMDGGNGRRYSFETFVEEFVPYLRFSYMYKGRNDSLHFDARYLQEIITFIENSAKDYLNLMADEDNYDSSYFSFDISRYYFYIRDSQLNSHTPEPILSWDDNDYGSVDEESDENPKGEVVITLWVKVPIVNTELFRWYCLEKVESDRDFLIITEWIMDRVNSTIHLPIYTAEDSQYARQYCENLFDEVHSDRSEYDGHN